MGGESLRSKANSKSSNPYLSNKIAKGLKSRSRFDEDYRRLQKSTQHVPVENLDKKRGPERDLNSPKKEAKM